MSHSIFTIFGVVIFTAPDATNLTEAVQAYLRSAYLRGAKLRGAYLRSAYLRGADLGGANLGGADLGGANLGGAYLGGAYLGGAYLRSANLRGANLRSAYLGSADLGSADLGGANLGGADLGGAYLGGADLGGANLTDAIGLPFDFEAIKAAAPALRLRVAEHIAQHPELHDQTNWGEGTDDPACGSPCCVAGWACHLGGGTRGLTVQSMATILLSVEGKPEVPFSASVTREEILEALRS